MDGRPGEQRLKRPQRQGRQPDIYGHRVLFRPRLDRPPHHLYDPLALNGEGQPRGQLDPLRQHHGQPRQGLRQQIPRIHECREGIGSVPHPQGGGPQAPPLIPPMDKMPNGADEDRQQTEAVDGRPQGHGAEKHTARPGACLVQGDEQQSAPQQKRCDEKGQKGAQILPAADDQRGRQQTPHPTGQAQKHRPLPQGRQVPQSPQQGRERRPFRGCPHAAQGPREPQQQPIHGEVVQQKPFQGDPHATSMTMTVMSSRWPLRFAAAMSDSAMRSKGASEPFFSSHSNSLPNRS